MSDINIIDSLISSLIGIALVFAVLVLLILIIKLMTLVVGTASKGKGNKETATAEEEQPELAKGSCGGVDLYDVPDKTAAMLMAITADKLNMPLNQLRFISIREIKDVEDGEKVTK